MVLGPEGHDDDSPTNPSRYLFERWSSYGPKGLPRRGYITQPRVSTLGT